MTQQAQFNKGLKKLKTLAEEVKKDLDLHLFRLLDTKSAYKDLTDKEQEEYDEIHKTYCPQLHRHKELGRFDYEPECGMLDN